MAEHDADNKAFPKRLNRREFLQVVGGGVAAAGVASLLGGCGTSGEAPKPTTVPAAPGPAATTAPSTGQQAPAVVKSLEEVTFGLVCSVTGPMALLGKKLVNGAQMRIDEINAAGGVAGKFKLKLVNEDDEGKAEIAAAMAQKMTNNKIQVIMTTSASTLDLAMNPIIKAAKTLMLVSNNTNPRITAENEYAFRSCFTNKLDGWAGAKFMYETRGARNVATLVDMSNEGSTNVVDYFQKYFQQFGGKIAASEKYSGIAGADTDFKPQLGRIKQANADAIYSAGYTEQGALIMKQLLEIGFKPKTILGTNSWEDEGFFKIASSEIGQLEVYITTHFASDNPDPDYQAWAKKYKARFNADPFSYDALSYDTTTLGAWALEKAGKYDGEAMRQALMTIAGTGQTVKGLLTAKDGFNYDKNRDAVKPVVIDRVTPSSFTYFATVQPPTESID